MNLFQASVERTADGFQLAVGERRIRIDEQEAAQHPGLAGRAGGRVVAGVRPERLGAAGTAVDRRLRGTVLLCEALGSDSLAYVAVEGATALSDTQSALANDVEDAVEDEELAQDETRAANVVARLDPRVQIGVGETLELEVVPRRAVFLRPGDRRGPRLVRRRRADPRTISSGGVATTTCPTWAPLIIVRIMSTERLPSSASGIRTVVSGGFR